MTYPLCLGQNLTESPPRHTPRLLLILNPRARKKRKLEAQRTSLDDTGTPTGQGYATQQFSLTPTVVEEVEECRRTVVEEESDQRPPQLNYLESGDTVQVLKEV